ncbi:MAG TPA: cardiolipin synthase [Chthoniobacteraceae bacterium]|jgi:cardiolipin synthase|nr:cardiolipin synthase [Chthoniobacteraceae bacterium]
MTEIFGSFDKIALAALIFLEIIAIATALDALMHARTPQGSVAWCIGLLTFPFIALPLYWILGRTQFPDYLRAIEKSREENAARTREIRVAQQPWRVAFQPAHDSLQYALNRLSLRGFTSGNKAELLVDGDATFDAIFEEIANAQSYVMVQTYIIHDDNLGRRLRDALLACAARGVRAYLLYDAIGCHALPTGYVDELRNGGCHVEPFGTGYLTHRYQINFRNHRKIVVVDGRVAFVGGHNFGDEYQGRSPRFGHWRDTHIRLRGPAVQDVQAVTCEDWFWATKEYPDLEWEPEAMASGGITILPLDTGPVRAMETCTIFFHELIAAARERLWIASPYFVPDTGIVNALQSAALRGVDVRIMLPLHPDHRFVWLASFAYLDQMDAAGVKVYRYKEGFLHQKVTLVDHRLAVVGTANFDNRSARLNFELSIVISDPGFAAQVAAMLERDFEASCLADPEDYRSRPAYFRALARLARLFAPVL